MSETGSLSTNKVPNMTQKYLKTNTLLRRQNTPEETWVSFSQILELAAVSLCVIVALPLLSCCIFRRLF